MIFMKTKIALVTLAMFLCCSAGLTQKTEGKKGLQFQSINQGGILIGSAEGALQLQTVNGVRSNTWFTGLGVGLDYYHVRSIPVFLDVRKDIWNKQKTPFVYADGGYNFPFLSKRNNQEALWMGDYDKGGGLYYEAGFGIDYPFQKKCSYYLVQGTATKGLLKQLM
jgi:hypothetical protein